MSGEPSSQDTRPTCAPTIASHELDSVWPNDGNKAASNSASNNSNNNNSRGSIVTSTAIDVSEFLPPAADSSAATTSATAHSELPQFPTPLPEPMNNYNIPDDPALTQAKLRLLQSKYPTFANKSLQDVEDLLKYPELFHSYFEGLEDVQKMHLSRAELFAQRRQLAEQNLRHMEELEKLRSTVKEQETLAESLNLAFSQLVHVQAEALRPYMPLAMLGRLKSAAQAAEEESEELITYFLSGSSNVSAAGTPQPSSSELESFVAKFLEVRKKYHRLAALSQAVENAEKNGVLEGAPLFTHD
ncbi:hypothetical protein EV182_003329 [Spiromyces aspiralis]|uniref:Uncharacterized protein n=1 Tax=Spiromyces aspiralis TaxID=68401 RepID=A0ACC1HQS1_9FUNG|nr:hypothetical protein EV182_003329 [Spiromyces aspiralis]